MIDGNISMEEDTELRDLVVQTLENNGVLAKVRAELRASVFLALEEQESVINPEPLLNKTVKQYLAKSEGKLLFSLVREFLEYFGLDYTISVYDPETYIGKEYNYMGRKKLCEKLGINSTEPLLGELLKNSINRAFTNSKNEQTNNSTFNKSNEETGNINNTTFDVSVPKVFEKNSLVLNDNDMSEKDNSISDFSQEIPINVTITDKKSSENLNNVLKNTSKFETQNKSLRENTEKNNEPDQLVEETSNNNSHVSFTVNNQTVTENCPNHKSNNNDGLKMLDSDKQLLKFEESVIIESDRNLHEEKSKLLNCVELQNTNNTQKNHKIDVENSFGKTVYFEELIVDGKSEKVGNTKQSDQLLENLPPFVSKTHSIFNNLPSLNGKKNDINNLKELMDIGSTSDVDNYEEDFASSASGSTNEQSPAKDSMKNLCQSPLKHSNTGEEKSQSTKSDEISEEIDDLEELDDVTEDKSITNFTVGTSLECVKKP
ncbi:putative uncharacterized protein DDB_G0293878 [Chelonus insularis]|uniref:putative uncharacterized protein DDB_G0293878 n=1 Tax=Chelonus insularis TaxID=460826 RepID=UPI00158BD7DA|nr:putative uncharacterized protein DDB_G0293878 [Chelonus insularis]